MTREARSPRSRLIWGVVAGLPWFSGDEMPTKRELEKRVKALQELNDLLLKQTTEQRKLLASLGIDRESSMEKWIV